MSGAPYTSSEDSVLLRRALRRFSGEACLEIGTGNGGTLVDLRGRFQVAVGTDLTPPSMTDWKGAGADLVLADRAGCFRDATFDLVAFNPPYLLSSVEDRTVDGGEDHRVPLSFLAEALRVVKPSGSVVWLLNGEADLEAFRRVCEGAGFAVSKLETERLFFEELSTYLAERQVAS